MYSKHNRNSLMRESKHKSQYNSFILNFCRLKHKVFSPPTKEFSHYFRFETNYGLYMNVGLLLYGEKDHTLKELKVIAEKSAQNN